jgi:large subunit ribosomal protein L25
MEDIVLKASRRVVTGKQVNTLRRSGQLPAVLYGRYVESMAIALDMKEASRVLEKLSSSALIVVEVDGQRHLVLVREKQRNPILGSIRHVDFQALSLTEKVRANVSIHLVGESPAVENYFGILVTSMEQLEVESLPRALPERIDVDVSNLVEIGDAIHVRELVLAEGVEILEDPDAVIVVVTAPIAEEVIEEEVAEAVTGVEPEVIERGKREEEEEE